MIMVAVILTVLAGLLGSFWIWFNWTHRRLLRVAKQLPPSLSTIPILGNSHHTFRGVTGFVEEALPAFIANAANPGCATNTLWLGPYPFIFVTRREDIQKILRSSTTLDKANEMSLMKHALGDGVLIAPTSIWKVTRRHMEPLFHPRNLERLMPVLNRNCRIMVDSMSQHAKPGKDAVDIREYTAELALLSMCHLLFGPELAKDTRSDEFKSMENVLLSISALALKRALYLWLRIDSVFNFLYKKELQNYDKVFKRFSEAPLKHARTCYENKNKMTESSDIKSQGVLNIIDVYSELQKKSPQFNEDHLQSELMTLYLTGYDSISNALGFCFLLLAQYKSVQEKAFEEVMSVVGSDNDVTSDHIRNMPYLDQVLKETLRWSILVPLIARKTSEDIKLSSCTLPAGITVAILLGALSMDPNMFPDPLNFDPDRFAPGNPIEKDSCAYLPFSGGPRGCIGKMYSKMLMKVALVHVLRCYHLDTTVDARTLQRTMGLTLSSTEGYPVTLRERV